MLYKELNAYLDGNWSNERPPVNPSALVGDIDSKAQPNAATLETVTSAIRGVMEDKPDNVRPDTDDDDDPTLVLADNLRRMAISPSDFRFFGKSSGAMLLRTAIELKNEYAGKDRDSAYPEKPMMKTQREEFWTAKPVRHPIDILFTFLTYVFLVGAKTECTRFNSLYLSRPGSSPPLYRSLFQMQQPLFPTPASADI